MITIGQLRIAMPQCPASRAEKFITPLDHAMIEWHINDGLLAAMFLAQLAHESGCFQYMEELADGTVYEDRKDLGNDLPAAKAWAPDGKAGPWFKGHGPIQITGYKNHLRYGEILHPEDTEIYLRAPRQLCEPQDGCRSAAAFFSRECLKAADAGDFLLVSQIVNMNPSHWGTENKPNGWLDRQKYFECAKRAYGLEG